MMKLLKTPWALAVIFIAGAMTSGCSTSPSRPCAEAGDVSWNPPLKGDRRCYQKEVGGRSVNHGKFLQYFSGAPEGRVQLEGDFKEGLKHGYWIQYDETGRKIAERYFEEGVERATSSQTSGQTPGK